MFKTEHVELVRFTCYKSNWLHGQAVKTPPFHGGNRGSNPLGVTRQKEDLHWGFEPLVKIPLESLDRKKSILDVILIKVKNIICRRGSIGRAADL